MTDSGAPTEVAVAQRLDAGDGLTPALFVREARAAERFWDFFSGNIRNSHTRRAYYNAIGQFSEFCAQRAVHDLAQVRPSRPSGDNVYAHS